VTGKQLQTVIIDRYIVGVAMAGRTRGDFCEDSVRISW
jgi:hypothetical protein